jgi:hypothetical protein
MKNTFFMISKKWKPLISYRPGFKLLKHVYRHDHMRLKLQQKKSAGGESHSQAAVYYLLIFFQIA